VVVHTKILSESKHDELFRVAEKPSFNPVQTNFTLVTLLRLNVRLQVYVGRCGGRCNFVGCRGTFKHCWHGVPAPCSGGLLRNAKAGIIDG
jgi:hypothetical protein